MLTLHNLVIGLLLSTFIFKKKPDLWYGSYLVSA